ncbi:MAG: Holliday junction branch migration protein RuvA [Candidatus Kapabacteria bacterium]|jgi:Holliday junction DNA helicase RuvA|nr:Holliday junction branch migration protein RuvA [Candidatus Kapabacteria bacterium]
MIAMLRGRFVSRDGMDVVIDCCGVGYVAGVPLSTIDALPALSSEITLLTVMVVREDAIQLFGFGTVAERQAFLLLTSITGIGPRTALGILSSSTLADLRLKIVKGDAVGLQRLPGIGKKTAERIVLELREKIIAIVPAPATDTTEASAPAPAVDEVVAALISLGYSRATAEKAVRTVLAANPEAAVSSEKLLRLALRFAGGQ